MNPSLPYLFGFLGGLFVAGLTFFLYERQNKQLRGLLEFTQRQFNAALAKMMAVDYEKLAELDIQARAMGQSAWLQAHGVVPEMGDMEMYNPEDFKVGKDAE